MNKKERMALFLGMLSGDGCLPIGHNGEGYRDYYISFVNTEKKKVILFNQLLYELFGLRGKINSRIRNNRKEIWEIRRYSKKAFYEIRKSGFPEGVKRDILRIPNIINAGTKKEKLAFIYGFIITDGSVGERRILFHSGSKLFLKDMSILISKFISVKKPIREFIQREKYKSYQLCLNKQEKHKLLSRMPAWHNGTARVLRVDFPSDV